MGQTLVISPVTRIEGHAEITIDLGTDGRATDARFSVQTFRGFEKFLEGIPAADIPSMTCRVCGICFASHGLAATKAIEAAWGLSISPAARKIRELLNYAQFLESHALALAGLSLPDFVFPGETPDKRNLAHLLHTHEQVARRLIQLRQGGVEITKVIGGRSVHPVNFVPGGVAKIVSAAEREKLLSALDGGDQTLLGLWSTLKEVLINRPEVMGLGGAETHYLAMTGPAGLEFYDGPISLISREFTPVKQFPSGDYFSHLKELEKDFSYMKFPVLEDGNTVRVGPLARANLAASAGSPLADQIFQEARGLVGFPTHNTMAFHIARLVETMLAWERAVALLKDDDISSPTALASGCPGKAGTGIGAIEAPRGLLIHQYQFDEKGRVLKARLVVATQHNNQAINDGLAETARKIIDSAQVPEMVLNQLEMVVRAYDPCLSCATHAEGQRPFRITVKDHRGSIVGRW